MKRRPFILGSLAFLSLPITTLAHSQSKPAVLLSRLAQLYPDRTAYNMISSQIKASAIERLPDNPSQLENWLQERLNITKDAPDNIIKAAISRSSEADFRTGRTIDVNGWRLSESEAFLCLALADY